MFYILASSTILTPPILTTGIRWLQRTNYFAHNIPFDKSIWRHSQKMYSPVSYKVEDFKCLSFDTGNHQYSGLAVKDYLQDTIFLCCTGMQTLRDASLFFGQFQMKPISQTDDFGDAHRGLLQRSLDLPPSLDKVFKELDLGATTTITAMAHSMACTSILLGTSYWKRKNNIPNKIGFGLLNSPKTMTQQLVNTIGHQFGPENLLHVVLKNDFYPDIATLFPPFSDLSAPTHNRITIPSNRSGANLHYLRAFTPEVINFLAKNKWNANKSKWMLDEF